MEGPAPPRGETAVNGVLALRGMFAPATAETGIPALGPPNRPFAQAALSPKAWQAAENGRVPTESWRQPSILQATVLQAIVLRATVLQAIVLRAIVLRATVLLATFLRAIVLRPSSYFVENSPRGRKYSDGTGPGDCGTVAADSTAGPYAGEFPVGRTALSTPGQIASRAGNEPPGPALPLKTV